jgi:hypothetical protein
MSTQTAPKPPPVLPAPPPVRPSPFPPGPTAGRDVALDLLRGIAMVVLVVNHIHLDSALEYATEPFLSAAEALVSVSGVVAGMVFGRRWVTIGARATSAALLRRSFVLYRASVAVVALVGLLTLVPVLATDALTVVPRTSGPDLYAFDGALRTALAIVTLEAGPWQFNILGFFIAALALAPALLFALDRGWWAGMLAASWLAFLAGRATGLDVLPSQSEGPFPFLVWQLLFVHGMVLGWHRDRVVRAFARTRGAATGAIVAVAGAAAYVRLHEVGLEPFGVGAADWARWDREHFDKATLDAARLVSMVAFTAVAYLVLRRLGPVAERAAGWMLLPLGRNSFYVFIVHVFVALAVASVPALADAEGVGPAGNAAVQVAALLLIVVMVRRRFLFRWIPR